MHTKSGSQIKKILTLYLAHRVSEVFPRQNINNEVFSVEKPMKPIDRIDHPQIYVLIYFIKNSIAPSIHYHNENQVARDKLSQQRAQYYCSLK